MGLLSTQLNVNMFDVFSKYIWERLVCVSMFSCAARFSSPELGQVCADNVLTPKVFKAVGETISDITDAVGGNSNEAAAKLQEMVELIKEGVVSSLLFSSIGGHHRIISWT